LAQNLKAPVRAWFRPGADGDPISENFQAIGLYRAKRFFGMAVFFRWQVFCLLKVDKTLVSKNRVAPGLTELFNKYLLLALKNFSLFYPWKTGTLK